MLGYPQLYEKNLSFGAIGVFWTSSLDRRRKEYSLEEFCEMTYETHEKVHSYIKELVDAGFMSEIDPEQEKMTKKLWILDENLI